MSPFDPIVGVALIVGALFWLGYVLFFVDPSPDEEDDNA